MRAPPIISRGWSGPLDPDQIQVPPEQRELNEDAVAALMNSITEIGQKTPITVRWVRENGEVTPILVAGRHRMEACRRLDREVQAVVLQDEREGALWRIAENLHRAELTVQERAEHISEWIRLTAEKVKAQVAPLDAPHARGRLDQGINAAARELGIDRTEVQRAVKIAAISPEAKAAAREAGLDDNQTALLRAAKETTTEAQVVSIQNYGTRPEPQKTPEKSTTSGSAAGSAPLGGELPPEVTRRYKDGSIRIGDERIRPDGVAALLGAMDGLLEYNPNTLLACMDASSRRQILDLAPKIAAWLGRIKP